MSTNTEAHIALLRGINVGGNNLLPMAELAQLFREAGAQHVSTYIQSGNVLFRAPPPVVATLAEHVSAAITARFGFAAPVQLRNRQQWAALHAANPFLAEGADPKHLHLVLLATPPNTAQLASLDPQRSPPDRFAIGEQALYLHQPNGSGRSKLTTAYFDSKLGTISTMRNWRTVTQLLTLLQAAD